MASYNKSLLGRLKSLAGQSLDLDDDDDYEDESHVSKARSEVMEGYRPQLKGKNTSARLQTSKGKGKANVGTSLACFTAVPQCDHKPDSTLPLQSSKSHGKVMRTMFKVQSISMVTCGLTDANELKDPSVPDKGDILEQVSLQLSFQDLSDGIKLDGAASADDVEKHFNELFEAALTFQDLQAPVVSSIADDQKAINHSMHWVLCMRKKGSQSLRVCSERPDGALLKHVKDTSEKATWKESKIFLALRREIDLDEYSKWLPGHIARVKKEADRKTSSKLGTKRAHSALGSDSNSDGSVSSQSPSPRLLRLAKRKCINLKEKQIIDVETDEECSQRNLPGLSNRPVKQYQSSTTFHSHKKLKGEEPIVVTADSPPVASSSRAPPPTQRGTIISDQSLRTAPIAPVTPQKNAGSPVRPLFSSPELGSFKDPWDADATLDLVI